MSHGMRRRLLTMDGIYIQSAAVPLVVDDGGITPPPPPPPPSSGARLLWRAASPWYTQIDKTSAIYAATSGRTFTQWTSPLNHAYVNSDHTSDAPTNTWHTTNADPIWSITGMYNGNVSVGGTASIRIPAGVYGSFASGDGNLNVWNHDTGYHYDFYNFRNINNTARTANADAIWQLHESEDGWGTGVYPNGRARGVRAAGCQQAGGDITAADWRAGIINHGLAMAAARSNWKAGTAALPAVKTDGGESGYTGNVPLGTMLAIPPTISKPSGLTTIGSMAWDAARDYGIYCVDSTGSWAFVADDGNDPISNSWVDPLRYSPWDGDKIINAVRICTRGKPSLPNHA